MRSRRGNACFTLLIVVLVIAACVWFYHAELSDHAQGFRAGVSSVRQARRDLGAFGDVTANIALSLPTDRTKSEDWNAGFRAGVRDELQR